MTRDSAAPAKPILVFRSYARSLLWLFLGMVVSFLIFGLLAPYWNKAMANLLAVHEALLYNEGFPQYFLWYPAHLSPILLGLWYQFLHLVGLLPEYNLSELSDHWQLPPNSTRHGRNWWHGGTSSFLSLAACLYSHR